MKRKHFLLLASLIAFAFSFMMLLAPSGMTAMIAGGSTPALDAVMRLIGGNLLAVTIMDWMVRNHAWSSTLRAVLLCNVLLHLIAIALDLYGYLTNVFTMQAIGFGLVVHLLMAGGFAYYMMRADTRDSAAAVQRA